MLQLDAERFAKHFSDFVALADAGPGLQAYVGLLEAKHRLFAAALAAYSVWALRFDCMT